MSFPPVAVSYGISKPRKFRNPSYFVRIGWVNYAGYFVTLTTRWSDGSISHDSVVSSTAEGAVAEAKWKGIFWTTALKDRPALVIAAVEERDRLSQQALAKSP